MKIFSRLSQLIKSNLNAALDRMTDPAKEIDQLVLEMEDELRKTRNDLFQQIAQVKRQEKRVDEHARNIYRFQEHAKQAVTAGDDELAKEALRRLQEEETKLAEAKRLKEEQSEIAARMTEQIRQRDQKLAHVKQRKETLKAQATMHKRNVSNQGSAFDRFDQLVSQIELNEFQAEAMVEMVELQQEGRDLSSTKRLDRLLADPSHGVQEKELEFRLQALKTSLGKDNRT